MSHNPYQSPRTDADTANAAHDAERDSAQRHVRIAMTILMLPAIYNFICFNFPAESYQPPLPIYNVYRVLNLTGLIAITTLIWFFGLFAFEFLTGRCHALFSRGSELAQWKRALYETMNRTVPYAIVGAILWAIWVFAFYQLDIGFYAISYPVGALANLVAAALYVPLFYRWYKIARDAQRPLTT